MVTSLLASGTSRRACGDETPSGCERLFEAAMGEDVLMIR